MTILQSIILGVVQGLTELLPISSSAHLAIIPWLFNWEISDSFDVALHAGTLLAIVVFFFKNWIELLIGGYKSVVKKEKNPEGRMLMYLIIATIPGGTIGFILDKYCEDILAKPIIISIALIIMGIILYIVDKRAPSDTKYEDMTLKQTFLIGLSQALAFIPGVSRSGITMTIGRALGVARESAARYSFMLSAPIVFAATAYKLKDFDMNMAFIVGVLTSFLTGVVVIKFLLQYLKKADFKIFAIYRIIFGLVILAAYFIV